MPETDNFSSWLRSQGLRATIADAMVTEMGIGSHEVFLACTESDSMRAELLSFAKQRFPFAIYAELRSFLESFWMPQVVRPGSALVDVLCSMLKSVSWELSSCAQKLSLLESSSDYEGEVHAVEEGFLQSNIPSPVLQEPSINVGEEQHHHGPTTIEESSMANTTDGEVHTIEERFFQGDYPVILQEPSNNVVEHPDHHGPTIKEASSIANAIDGNILEVNVKPEHFRGSTSQDNGDLIDASYQSAIHLPSCEDMIRKAVKVELCVPPREIINDVPLADEIPRRNGRQFACSRCSQTFRNGDTLKKHMKRHLQDSCLKKMPQTSTWKTAKGRTPPDVMMRAVDTVINEKRSIRSVAQEYNICHVTLMRYVRKKKNLVGLQDESDDSRAKSVAMNITVGYIPNRQVFTDAQENEVERYILAAANIYFGLTPKEICSLAYQCATMFKVKMPPSWIKDECAGPVWFAGYLKRHRNLSIRIPEATSLARASGFNRENVKQFFTKLAEVMDRYHFQPNDIWNVDEFGVTTVQKPINIVAKKSVKQMGAITSAERGELVTLCPAVSAIGSVVPPMLIFPRKIFKDHFIRDGPTGCIGTAVASGWMDTERFLVFLKHFVSNVRPSNEHPVLVLLDNHNSHLGIDILNYANDNGVVFLSFPTHCSHKLQPLDHSVFGLLKKYVPEHQDAWMINNPGKTMTIYDLPFILRDAWPSAATPANIMKGFKVSGIYPYNSDIFTDYEYADQDATSPEVQQSSPVQVQQSFT
uniref:uncharacterized protein n=2 Tax=Myxine glutinosa TaxID=7769 RepID=UPI00358FE895